MKKLLFIFRILCLVLGIFLLLVLGYGGILKYFIQETPSASLFKKISLLVGYFVAWGSLYKLYKKIKSEKNKLK